MAAILATCAPEDIILLPRNVHQSAIAGIILAGAIPVFITPIYDPTTGLVINLTTATVAKALAAYPQAKALLIVSPTYEGICADISAIADLTRTAGIPLIVDEAHGAHFCCHAELPQAALAAGADLVVQSTHKVLAAFTQAAMLHLQGQRVHPDGVNRALRLLQSSSPSYLLLASLDAARQQLAIQGEVIYSELLNRVDWVRQALQKIPNLQILASDHLAPYPGQTIDPTRLTLGITGLGLTGYQADEILDATYGVTAELPTWHTLTFILGLGTTQTDLEQLVIACQQLAELVLPPLQPLPLPSLALAEITPLALSPRTAYFAGTRSVPVEQAVGEISADWVCAYPPGIPSLFPGEQITPAIVANLRHLQTAGASLSGCADLSLQTLQVVDLAGKGSGFC
jgi:arginine decarboxylase